MCACVAAAGVPTGARRAPTGIFGYMLWSSRFTGVLSERGVAASFSSVRPRPITQTMKQAYRLQSHRRSSSNTYKRSPQTWGLPHNRCSPAWTTLRTKHAPSPCHTALVATSLIPPRPVPQAHPPRPRHTRPPMLPLQRGRARAFAGRVRPRHRTRLCMPAPPRPSPPAPRLRRPPTEEPRHWACAGSTRPHSCCRDRAR